MPAHGTCLRKAAGRQACAWCKWTVTSPPQPVPCLQKTFVLVDHTPTACSAQSPTADVTGVHSCPRLAHQPQDGGVAAAGALAVHQVHALCACRRIAQAGSRQRLCANHRLHCCGWQGSTAQEGGRPHVCCRLYPQNPPDTMTAGRDRRNGHARMLMCSSGLKLALQLSEEAPSPD